MDCWKDEPGERQYVAAHCYLSLLMDEKDVDQVIDHLRGSTVVVRQAKDILRASGLDSQPPTNPKVAKKVRKLASGKSLAPVLLVRGSLQEGRKLIIADGFHRLCAVIAVAPGAKVRCKMADLREVPTGFTANGVHAAGTLATNGKAAGARTGATDD